jgi:tetratricopeptide (TPR) repeat protein
MTVWLVFIGLVITLLAAAGGVALWFLSKRTFHWYYLQAVDAYKAEDYLTARKHLVKSLKMNGTYSNAWYTLGLIAQNECRLDSALEFYEKALEFTPEDTYALFNKGQVLINKGNFEDAKTVFETLLGLDENDPEVIYSLSVCQQELDDADNARESITKVLEINTRHIDANFKMGGFLADDGEFFDASTHYKTTLEEDEEYTPAYIELASCVAKQQEWRECIEICQKGTLKDPNNPRLYNQLGLAHFYLSEPDEAIRYYRLAVQMDPAYYLAYNNLGYALENQGDIEEAIEAFKYYMQYVRGTPAAKETLQHIRELEKDLSQKPTQPKQTSSGYLAEAKAKAAEEDALQEQNSSDYSKASPPAAETDSTTPPEGNDTKQPQSLADKQASATDEDNVKPPETIPID